MAEYEVSGIFPNAASDDWCGEHSAAMGDPIYTGPLMEQVRLVVLEAANKGEAALCAIPGYGDQRIRLIAHKDLDVGEMVTVSDKPPKEESDGE